MGDLPHRWARGLRWALLVPGALLAWVLGLLLTILVDQGIFSSCPAQELVSGMCVNAGVRRAQEIGVYVCAALSALLVEGSVLWIAPEYKRVCVWVSFVAGVVIAREMTGPQLIDPLFLTVVIAGLAGAIAASFFVCTKSAVA